MADLTELECRVEIVYGSTTVLLIELRDGRYLKSYPLDHLDEKAWAALEQSNPRWVVGPIEAGDFRLLTLTDELSEVFFQDRIRLLTHVQENERSCATDHHVGPHENGYRQFLAARNDVFRRLWSGSPQKTREINEL